MATLPLQSKILIGQGQDVKYTVNEAMYGDGYKRISPKGINNKRPTFTMMFPALKQADRDTLVAFLDANIGVAFQYTPPGESVKNAYAVSYSEKTTPGDRFDITLTAEFLYGTF